MSTTETPKRHHFPFPRTSPLSTVDALAEVRENEPIAQVELWNGSTAWLATRYDDVRALLGSSALTSDTLRPNFPQASGSAVSFRSGQRAFARMDPPEHDQHRLMLTAEFTVKRMRELRPYLDNLIDSIFDDMEAKGGVQDLVEVFAQVVPASAVTRLLGLPAEDSDFLLDRVNTQMSLDSAPGTSTQAGEDILDYFDQLIESRRDSDADDFLSRLIRDRLKTGQLNKEELKHMLNLLVVGGFDTTANMISLGTLTFLQNPDQLAKLQADPSLLANAVEELLRYLTVAHHVAYRQATEPIDIGDKHIEAGDGVIAPLIAANHDPAIFPSPKTFDITRDVRGHLAFGYGVHQCLGQPLARAELQAVFAKIFERFPNLQLAVPEEDLEYRNSIIYGVAHLPVRW